MCLVILTTRYAPNTCYLIWLSEPCLNQNWKRLMLFILYNHKILVYFRSVFIFNSGKSQTKTSIENIRKCVNYDLWHFNPHFLSIRVSWYVTVNLNFFFCKMNIIFTEGFKFLKNDESLRLKIDKISHQVVSLGEELRSKWEIWPPESWIHFSMTDQLVSGMTISLRNFPLLRLIIENSFPIHSAFIKALHFYLALSK